MSVIVYPGYDVASFRWSKADQAIPFRSSFGAQALVTSVPLWEVEMVGPQEKRLDAHAVEAFIESLNGFSNQVSLWNLQRPAPIGTLRGTLTLTSNAAQGATSALIDAGWDNDGKTLVTGDMLGLGSGLTQQVVRVTANAACNSEPQTLDLNFVTQTYAVAGPIRIQVSFHPPLRNAFAAGAAVTWDKPRALFRQKTLSNGIEYVRSFGRPWSLCLVEDWRP